MGKIAFVFSGQGDQYPGMGKELAEKYAAAETVYAACDGFRPGTSAQCFEGTEEELKDTRNTQPCLFATELAAASVLLDKGVTPEAVAGFSLGEVAAATVSGMFDLETGFRLVCRRGELMQREADKFDTFMAAVVKLTQEEVQEICDRYPEVYPVNFNCPGQVTVSGLSAQMTGFLEDVKTAGGRAIPLKVKGAFHSPFMREAARAFAEELARTAFRERKITLYSNLTAKPYTESAAGLLSGQICSPVQWEKIIRNMIADGIDTFIEIGPGKTLCNMIKRIDGGVRTATAAEYLAEVEAC
ncbi:ACP S-malonyltransferase [Aristaeella hokkaidonensis]|uniref:ACP S-malonyltransferase n=1 Tax=Aristaeella hokkaidonensis TaxID=3046382 RepID=A0AC61MYP8_9FIRM|nr:ACP S-malonyltransferase [Aristaeella hokkaidonensis]QUC68277.1 ACP S-malonyltransferase [Aristaeella hokkaidonensis]SNT95377.1 [acyl-carrier-protein] S-malonyltransferase [Aristaeella hokkaidonensis]